jgi:hypothetical protein
MRPPAPVIQAMRGMDSRLDGQDRSTRTFGGGRASVVRSRRMELPLPFVVVPGVLLVEQLADEFPEGFVGGAVAGVVDVVLEFVEQFIGIGVTLGGVAGEGAVEDPVEAIVDPGVERAEIGEIEVMMRSRDSSGWRP